MKWGIIGCADIAKNAVIPTILSIEENVLVAVAGRSEEKVRLFSQLFDCDGVVGYDRLLDRTDIEAVYIPLPTGMHYEWVIRALEKGKHVLVEKSAGTHLVEVQKMVSTAQKNQRVLVENFQFQHHSQHRYVRELIQAGEIGDIRCFRSSFGFPPFALQTNIRYDKALGGGALLDAGAYVLKATSTIMGSHYEVKAAHLTYHKEYGVDWFGGAFLANEETGVISEVAFGFDNFYQCNYEVWGSKGKVTSTRAFTAKKDHTPVILLETPAKVQEIHLPRDDHFRNMLLYFNRLVLEKDYAAEANKMIEQARLIQKVNDIATHSRA